MNRFDLLLKDAHLGPLRAENIDTLQVNLGTKCNQNCTHCHQTAGPDRTESMSSDTVDLVLSILDAQHIATLDITGGAPELHPDFRRLVAGARDRGINVAYRCNLTALLLPDQSGLGEFLRSNRAAIMASLPCYTSENVDAVRGDGVFDSSVKALRLLNELGYGVFPALRLDLVYNPRSATLPSPAASLEEDYRQELWRLGVSFNRLITMTNSPIGRFASFLRATGQLGAYTDYLADRFSPETVPLVMCRQAVSVGWDGRLYDCDFNLALTRRVSCSVLGLLSRFNYDALRGRQIVTGDHCLACTAGAGSSCGGALVPESVESIAA